MKFTNPKLASIFPGLWALTAFPLLLWAFAAPALATDPTLQPKPPHPRPSEQVLRDWQESTQALRIILPSPQAFADPDARKEIAPTAIPMLNRTLALCDEMYQSDPPNRDRTRKLHYQLLAMLAFLDDKTALAELDDARQGNMRDIAILGRHAWYLAQWWKNVEDEKKSAALLDELEKLATANPLDDDLAALLIQLQQEGTADDAQLHRLETIITAHLRGPLALKFTAEIKLAEKRRSLLGKPLLISAPTLKGQPFTSKSLLGHLVLVHFGISSLGPWEQEHNLLLQQYAKLQDQDIQVITILCDEKQEDVDQYVQRHRAIPWPVLRDPTRPANLAALYGIEQFPQALLLAPDGTVKQVDVNLHDPQALANLLTSLATTRPTTRP